MTTSERMGCPDCGRDVAVRIDGTLYAHHCANEPAAAAAEAGPAPQPRPECRVAACGRMPLLRGLCGAHYAARRGEMGA